MKKTIIVIVVAVVLAAGVIGGFWWWMGGSKSSAAEEPLTDVQKIITTDLDKNYPPTPRAVVKQYTGIEKIYYGSDEFSDEELKQMTQKAWALFDPDLQQNNVSEEVYLEIVKKDIQEFKDKGRQIYDINVCDTDDVRKGKTKTAEKGKSQEMAQVTVKYFVKENGKFNDTYETYELRKDEEGRWRIRTFHKTAKPEGVSED